MDSKYLRRFFVGFGAAILVGPACLEEARSASMCDESKNQILAAIDYMQNPENIYHNGVANVIEAEKLLKERLPNRIDAVCLAEVKSSMPDGAYGVSVDGSTVFEFRPGIIFGFRYDRDENLQDVYVNSK
ncbi:MAG: hypothetical protein EOR81_09310 [Mesorhizobium sp.]|nr:MAG: hypothetical protein EOR81_09310 [Mesorhizobium sp.]